jgi:hypothetical protein
MPGGLGHRCGFIQAVKELGHLSVLRNFGLQGVLHSGIFELSFLTQKSNKMKALVFLSAILIGTYSAIGQVPCSVCNNIYTRA